MGSEDQTSTVHSKKIKRSSHNSRGKNFYKNNPIKYFSRSRCYTCDEVGHFAKDCRKRQNKKKGNKRRHHAHALLMLQRMMNLPQRESNKKVMILQVMKNMS